MTRITDYDAVAGGYDVRYRNYDYAEIKEALTAFLGTAPVGAILEAGCGTGYWLKELRGRAPRIAGIDRSAEMIARAKDSGATLVRARAESLPWRDETFDRIVCLNALHHFADRERFFAECRRVLTPHGGVFNVGLDPHALSDLWWIYDYFPETVAIDQQRYPSRRAIRDSLIGADFTTAESYEVQTFAHAISASRAFERGLVSRSFSSQLAVLSDDEFAAGQARIRDADEALKKEGGELTLASELHLFATIGWLA